MKKNIVISLLIVFFVTVNTNASGANLAFVNLDNILQKSNLGIKILSKLQERKKLEENEVNDRENNIKTLEEEIRKKQNIISKDEFQAEVTKLQKNILYKNKNGKTELSKIHFLKIALGVLAPAVAQHG